MLVLTQIQLPIGHMELHKLLEEMLVVRRVLRGQMELLVYDEVVTMNTLLVLDILGLDEDEDTMVDDDEVLKLIRDLGEVEARRLFLDILAVMLLMQLEHLQANLTTTSVRFSLILR